MRKIIVIVLAPIIVLVAGCGKQDKEILANIGRELGVPVTTRSLQGLDSLLSIVQMPKGVPVATFAIGDAGAANAGLFAVATLARNDAKLAKKLAAFRKKQTASVRAMKLPVKK